jgi:hypothetical protein
VPPGPIIEASIIEPGSTSTAKQKRERNMKTPCVRKLAAALAMAGGISLAALPAGAAPTCPLSYNQTDAAKSHKLFLYFPTANDATFPNYGPGVSPAVKFDVADLDPGIGTTSALIGRIHDVVVDDYCEFNVQVLQTTTNPAQLASPPPRRVTVAVGSDNVGNAWGLSQEIDLGDKINIDFSRVWAGTYVTCEGGNQLGGCSMTGSLTGANSTLDHWAQAIGGTAAHEAGHTYGLSHSDDNPPNDCSDDPGPGPLPGEDSLERHLMPAGCNLTGPDRADYRRHFSDRTFGLLAANVGLSIQTMHNWDLVNPNSATAHSLAIDFLSQLPAVNVDWTWTGATSPWINPVVTGPAGTAVWQGKTYNRYRITWSQKNPAFPTPGLLGAGATFHVGATFTGVDFNQPDPIVIQNITLFDAGSNALTLHPRLPIYDAGALDSADGSFSLHFFQPFTGSALTLQSAAFYQLPRVATIESMNGVGSPLTFDGQKIIPWSSGRCTTSRDGSGFTCTLGNIADTPHVQVVHRVGEPGVYDCSNGVPKLGVRSRSDSPGAPDDEGPICAGTARDPFPSATIYAIATFVDPAAEHWDPTAGKMVIGPVSTKVFYQFAGVRDLTALARTTK